MNVPSATIADAAPATPANTSTADNFTLKLLAPVAYLAVLIASAFAAYWAMFSQFAPYDDSGYFINSIRLFIQGQTLYDRVWSDYGPFSYELWVSVFGLTGQTLSTDSGRLAVVGVWLLTSLLLGVSAQRLTGRLALGVIVQVLSFRVLTALTAEPMHASGVVCLLLALTITVVSFVLPRRAQAALLTLGALVAALVLTKVNVGGFVAIAVAYATVMALPALRRVALLRWLAAFALVAIGPLLMVSNLTHQWVQRYAILAVAGTLAIVLIVDIPDERAPADAEDARRWVSWLVSGFVVCAVVVIAIVLALGTSVGAFVHETVIVPTHQTHAFTLPITLRGALVAWALVMLAAAWGLRRLRARSLHARQPGLLDALGRIIAALAIWLSILVVHAANFGFALTLAWVAAIPSSRDDGSLQARFVRLLLPALAALQTLTAYPVAGSQVKFGSLLLLVCGAVCFADGWSDLEALGATQGTRAGALSPRTIMAAFATVLAIAFALLYLARPLKDNRSTYDANPSLPIAGATHLHLPAAQAATYAHITTLLRAHCRSVITLPGLLSFNLWSGLPAPSGLTAEPFWHLLSRAQEQSALARARATPGLCSVRSPRLAAFWDSGKPLPQAPLVNFIERDFTPIARFKGYVVSVRST